jgi:hypothetical protein
MTMKRPDDPTLPPPSAADLDLDRRLESLLDEIVASSPALPAGFAAEVSRARPFAPWEVRRPAAWRAPLLAAAGLLVASLAVFLAPLGQLSSETAVRLWGHLLVTALSSPAPAILAGGPALASAADALRSAVSPAAALALSGAGAAVGAAAVATLRRRLLRARR